MTWEYMTLVVRFTPTGAEVLAQDEQAPAAGSQPTPLHQVLNTEGERGWELHSIHPLQGEQGLAILKRSAAAAEEFQRVERDRHVRQQALES